MLNMRIYKWTKMNTNVQYAYILLIFKKGIHIILVEKSRFVGTIVS